MLSNSWQKRQPWVSKVLRPCEAHNDVAIFSVVDVCMCVYIAVTKFGLLCELYTRNKKEMSKSEKQEVLEYLRGR